MISIIAAIARNGVIGKNNQLPWKLPTDMKRFRALTIDHPVIMGRKTFDSIGKPLKDRLNIVVTRTWVTGLHKGCLAASSLDNALAMIQRIMTQTAGKKEVFVIGGAEIYKEALPIADRMYLTLIQQDFDGDVYFPPYDNMGWIETDRSSTITDDEYPYEWVTFMRNKIK
jgi:dihydrofolate reductase